MIYGYFCNNCETKCDIIKPASDYKKDERCKDCNAVMTKDFAPVKVYFSGTAVQDKKFQPALGRVATDSELKKVAKEKNWIEIGNERVEKHVKSPDTEYPTVTDDDIRALTSK